MSVFIPAWVDSTELCRQICISPGTIDNWVDRGLLPLPRKRGGKLMWKWAEVDEYLTNGGKPGGGPDAEAEAIRNATQRELEKL